MRKKDLPPGEGLLLTRCRQIHTFFMLIAIDVVFIDKNGMIVELFSGMPPGKISPYVKKACQVLELPEGTILNYSLEREMILKIAESGKRILNVRKN